MARSASPQRDAQRQSGLRQQPLVLFGLVLLFCSAMVARLVWLQVLEGPRYRQLADENRIRLVPRSPTRGRLLDRKGRVLASSKLTYSLYVEPRLVDDASWPELRDRLASLLDLKPSTLDRRRQSGPDRNGYRINLASELSSEQVLRFREQSLGLKGAQVDVDILRAYPHGTLAAHTLGYTQPITEEEYTSLADRGYKIRDRIGRIGVEAAYESHLRGKWGGQMLEVNAMGEVQRHLGDRPSVAGKDLTLTLDLDLQKVAEQALADKPGGAIVAMDPRNGAILALASKPNFDPNFFSKLVTTQKEYDALFSNPKKPLLSRAMNAYDPGSTWKPVTAMAGMASGKFPPEVKLNTTSCITYGGHCFPDHNGAGFGRIGYSDALRFSSNTFFYQVGVGAGSLALKKAATQLGFGRKTGIEIGWEENVGLVGDEEWAKEGRGWAEPGSTPWIPEDMASASIGQSVVQITPLQLARAYCVFANGGWLVTPHLVDQGLDWTAPSRRSKVSIKPATLAKIREGLRKVVEDGTGYGLNGEGIPPAAGKTGTAEDSTGGPDHAWFASYAPYPNGEIVVVAFAQNTPGGGSVHALPMAKKVIEVWNRNRKQT
ncbi:transpeptidase involved in septal peptidoglycan synthesis (peptidoglycan synthetase precursor) [Synechococcus sp. SYN20]|uniref:penicillin-binding protein 2 n=1 Tax=Synechococcus sp. SYN20 TaxID=1050714 RepID=UPI0016484100|nr:penicillin-binding protein 2 [Synechococcus sp. SYN20]QNJ24415.1 transpeptidase involved in septal peptidoglycan synthesis (peptidoglycan synthetase precursor) [Synechococcus sp. SYN20]